MCIVVRIIIVFFFLFRKMMIKKKSQKNQNILGSFSLVVSVTKQQMKH